MASEWRASTWGEEISLEYGKALRDYDKASGKYRVFGSNGPIGWTDKPLASGPGVILGRKGAYRGIEFSRTPFFVIDTAYYVVPKSEFDMRWLYYAIKYHKLGEIDDGSPIPSTTRSAIYVRDFDVPPLAEQKAIAAVLGALDDKIELNRRMNATLEAMARALFQSWFVDFDPVRAKLDGRQPPNLAPANAALFPDSFQESELGQIPKGWRVMKVGEFIERLSVGQKYEQKTVSRVGKVPVFDQGKSGVIGFHNNEPGVTATLDNPVAVFANHTCYMRLITYSFSAIQNVLPFVGSGVDTFWAYYATEGRLSFSEYKGHWPDFVIQESVVPPRELTHAFGRFAKPLVAQMRNNEEESRTLATLRDTLLPKLLSGELSVEGLESKLETPS
jgi:type I restriction enzyme S subunit